MRDPIVEAEQRWLSRQADWVPRRRVQGKTLGQAATLLGIAAYDLNEFELQRAEAPYNVYRAFDRIFPELQARQLQEDGPKPTKAKKTRFKCRNPFCGFAGARTEEALTSGLCWRCFDAMKAGCLDLMLAPPATPAQPEGGAR